MKPLVQAALVNDRFGDPGIYLDFLFQRRALLFDLGDISALAPRKMLRLSHVFVSHAHMDHFSGFDMLLRTLLGRGKRLSLYGPPGFVGQLAHKLAAYSWNLVQNFPENLTLEAAELGGDGKFASALFQCRTGFAREDLPARAFPENVLLEEPAFCVRAAVLDHGIPCLAFALEERRHVNIYKARLEEMGLGVGPWLQKLKSAVIEGAADATPIRAAWREDAERRERVLPLGELKERALRVVPGQKIAYVTDIRFHEENLRRITELAGGADILFIETPFLDSDAEIAGRKNHLTAAQAGYIARQAGAKAIVPFHFSPRYAGQEGQLIAEAEAAFRG